MAVTIPPLAFLALRYGAVALAGYVAARHAPRGRFSRAVEAEMDAAPPGVHLARDESPDGRQRQVAGSARLIRTFGTGRLGPRFRIDATALARLKIRRLA